ncbi:response regulator [Sulfurimonas sp. SAG-AH-194-I05]|nr:ATP-binding protein [Sulfurimonas sp. SAG-AH-194-I05]MDF1875495.1 response regulator [Sulfurimonas sp. SAG-AH-194-I05]
MIRLNQKKDKLMLKQSRTAQEKLNKSLNILSENVISSSCNRDGIITEVSVAYCNISGYKKENLIGKSYKGYLHLDDNKCIMDEVLDVLKITNIWIGELEKQKKNGKLYWVRSSIIATYNNKKEIVGYTSIEHDITAEKSKEKFMANMSHELRTPLNSIIGFSALLQKKLENKKYKDFAHKIQGSSKSLLALINDILDLSKIKDSSFTIEPYSFNAYNEILSITHHFVGLSTSKHLVFHHTIDTSLQNNFFGDWQRISQIILNLISNAVKFTPNEGEITLDVTYVNTILIIKVIDNGIGMNKETQDRIFQPFEQADNSISRKYGGTGLGLSITQSLVDLMGGKIELESKEGKGSTFSVKIPLKKLESTQGIKIVKDFKEEKKENSLQGHILVVEDNRTNQILVEMLLEDFGLTCDMANDGLEAIDMYKPHKYNLVLMDENMPNMNGLEAMKVLRKKYKDSCSPIISLTANAMAGDRDRFLKAGMDGYVVKPIDEDDLYHTLAKYLLP